MSQQDRRYILKSAVAAAALAIAGAAPALAAEPVHLGVSIPAATHSFMGGINYWAEPGQEGPRGRA